MRHTHSHTHTVTHMQSSVLHQWKNWSPAGWKTYPPPPQGPNGGLSTKAGCSTCCISSLLPPPLLLKKKLPKPLLFFCFHPFSLFIWQKQTGIDRTLSTDSTHSLKPDSSLNNSNTSFNASSSFSPRLCAQITGWLLNEDQTQTPSDPFLFLFLHGSSFSLRV